MIPDKIYVREYPDGDYTTWWDEKPHEEESIGMKAVCYIRKGALMEWATMNRDRLDALSDNDAWCWGLRNAFQQMIDKLNEM